MGTVFAFLSGKGGTGKTTVCAGTATALAASGAKVLCIDCDVGLRNLDISLGLPESGGLSFLDVCQGGYALSQAVRHPDYESLFFLTAPMNLPVERIPQEDFLDMLSQAREEFDFIFLDAPAGVDAGFRLTAAGADRVLLVTGPGPAAVRDAARVGELLELMGKQDVRLILNRVDRDMLGAIRLTVDDVMDSAGLPLEGIVMEDSHITLAAAFGQPLLRYARRCTAAGCFRRIAKRLQGYRQAIPWK